MADIAKYAPINSTKVISDFKSQYFRTKKTRTVAFAYAFIFVFIAFTIFLAFSPSSNSSSPWFTNVFSTTTTTSPSSTSVFSDESYRSHFSSIYNYFFPNSSSSVQSHNFSPQNNDSLTPHLDNKPSGVDNGTKNGDARHKDGILRPNNGAVLPQNQTQVNDDKDGVLKQNQTQSTGFHDKDGVLKQNQTRSTEFHVKDGVLKQNQTRSTEFHDKDGVLKQNQTHSSEFHDKGGVLKANQSTIGVTDSPETKNKTANSTPNSATVSPETANKTANSSQNSAPGLKDGEKVISDKGVAKNLTSSLMKKENNGIDDLIKGLMNCDLFDGNWVRDESYPLYKPGSCSLIDEQFNCFLNGRPDNGYHKLKWKPKGCTLPRLDGSRMLEMLRGKRLVFVGDSLNRNMWESLICILRNSVKDQKKVYEEFGRHHFRTEASYSFVFEDYKCTVEFFVSPFLVQEWEVAGKDGTKKETLRLDLIGRSADKYKTADIIVFNTGHWWTHEKTSTGKDYYQEGSHVYSDLNVLEAFRKALTTWGRWIDAHVNPMKSLVFFRGYSASHFSGGQWNSGGACDHETEPIKNDTYLTPYPPKMTVLEKVLKGMKNKVTYLNITRMTDYRKDGHPSIYRKQHYSDAERKSPLTFQDCSHWCLPGVPDAWNEILYAELLVKLNQKQHQGQKRA